MCEYTSVPAQRGARIVVSLIGESLSPNIEPLTAVAESILLEADVSRKKRKKKIDQLAAVQILQTWLDRNVK